MAFRIHDNVARGEVDNRVKGVVRGALWLHGRAEPVTLELTGNAHPDVAGCLLKFTNPLPPSPHPRVDGLAALQRGTIGDLTASRKVRVPAVPMEEFVHSPEDQGRPPERLANCLYLEWFSEANGRVVIESADYELEITAPEWRLTAEEEAQRAEAAAAGMAGFLQQLNAAIERHRKGAKDPEADRDEHDYERFLKECDARTDKYMELLEKYGDSDEAEPLIAKEMGWDPGTAGADAEDDECPSVEEMNRICEEAANEPPPEPDPLTEGKDWIRTPNGDFRHPLQHRCLESAIRFRRECAEQVDLEACEDDDLHRCIFEFQTTAVKLGGALTGIAEGRGFRDDAFTVAYLKRALDHLHKAQAALESLAPKQLLPAKTLAAARRELLELREGILQLMDEFRGWK